MTRLPEVGDIWNYTYDASTEPGVNTRTYTVLVLKYNSEENDYLCLTLDTGEIEYWNMFVKEEAECWRFIS